VRDIDKEIARLLNKRHDALRTLIAETTRASQEEVFAAVSGLTINEVAAVGGLPCGDRRDSER
jgi:hypothetical protein